jgi:hypothetical protein
VVDIVHEIKIKATPEQVFQALTTLEGLRPDVPLGGHRLRPREARGLEMRRRPG